MDSRMLEGTWRLLAFYMEGPDGQRQYPFGVDAVGYLTYVNGRMQANIMQPGRPPFASNDQAHPTPEEAMAAINYIGYSGRYRVDGNQVMHDVDVSLFPNWVGHQQVRLVAFDGPRLVLSTPKILFQDKPTVFTLVWERE